MIKKMFQEIIELIVVDNFIVLGVAVKKDAVLEHILRGELDLFHDV